MEKRRASVSGSFGKPKSASGVTSIGRQDKVHSALGSMTGGVGFGMFSGIAGPKGHASAAVARLQDRRKNKLAK